jgi:hypothetical protein
MEGEGRGKGGVKNVIIFMNSYSLGAFPLGQPVAAMIGVPDAPYDGLGSRLFGKRLALVNQGFQFGQGLAGADGLPGQLDALGETGP